MDEEPENLVLCMLRSIDEKVNDVQKDVTFLKERMGILENHAIDHKREVLYAEEALASQNVRLDSIFSKLGRIMRRLSLVDEINAPPDKVDTETHLGVPLPDYD